MKAPILDTHIWIWWMQGDPQLPAMERDALDSLPAEDRPVLCDISLWEVAILVELGRVEFRVSLDDWLQVAASPATVRLQPIS